MKRLALLLLCCSWQCVFSTQGESSPSTDGFNPFKKLVLERPSQERFDKELLLYSKKVARKNKTKWLKRGALIGGSVVTLTGLTFLSRSLFGFLEFKKMEAVAQTGGESAWDVFKKGFLLSSSTGLVGVFLKVGYETVCGIKSSLWDEKKLRFSSVLPFAKRMENSLNRLKGAMGELPAHERDTFLFKHYTKEIIDSFDALVKSIEKVCAILLYELKHENNHFDSEDMKEVLTSGFIKYVNRLFKFCDYCALMIEEDYNEKEWDGFYDNTFDSINGFTTTCFGLLSYSPDFLMANKQAEQ